MKDLFRFGLEYIGNPVIEKYEFVLPAKTIYISDVKARITEICKKHGFSYKDMNNMLIVLDEACSNLVRHAYKEKEGDMRFEIEIRKKGMYLKLKDKGTPFDWKNFKTPNLNHYVNIGKKGGLGVWIIRKLTDKSDYYSDADGNTLFLVKYHSKPALINRIMAFITTSKGIKEKFAVATTMFILLLVGGIYFYFYKNEQDVLKEKFLKSARETLVNVARTAKDKLVSKDYLPLIKLLADMKKTNPSYQEIFVIDGETNMVVAHSDPKKMYTEFEGKTVSDPAKELYGVSFVKIPVNEGKGYIYRLEENVKFMNRDVGRAVLIVNEKGFLNAIKSKNSWQAYIIITGIIIAISALGIYLLLGLIIKPLMALKDGVVAIGEGRLDHRIELDGADEFTEIANAFNDMAVKFKGAQEAVIEQEKVQKEIQVAKEIQQTLLPRDEDVNDTVASGGFDIASLYRSAKEVGGDYYDILKVSPGFMGIIVADVSGKGVPGALVMTITRTVVRLISQKNKSSKNVLVKVNNVVKEDMKKGMFVTAFYLVLDSVKRRITFSCAGHDPLLLYRAKEDKVYWIKPKGFPLGISLPDDELFKKIMTEESLKLQKDDLLLVYTDGVTEAMNGMREQWGEKRFVETVKKYGRLPAKEFIDMLDQELRNFTQGYPQNDDITLVAIKEKKTESVMLKKYEKQIQKLREKGMKDRDIEEKLGVNIANVKAALAEGKKKKEDIKFLTFEEKKALMNLIVKSPEANVKAYTGELMKQFNKKIDEKLVVNELKRVNLMTLASRKKYAAERS